MHAYFLLLRHFFLHGEILSVSWRHLMVSAGGW